MVQYKLSENSCSDTNPEHKRKLSKKCVYQYLFNNINHFEVFKRKPKINPVNSATDVKDHAYLSARYS